MLLSYHNANNSERIFKQIVLQYIYFQCRRTLLIPTGYIFSGILGLAFLANLSTAASVVLFVLLQGWVVSCFFLLDAYTPDLFSTDTRNFAFALLDSVSKVSFKKAC